jgi:hypothetical protein
MPTMTPVGQDIKPPDPHAGVGLMSSILGVRQQQQNLATGQINQNTAQADSQQAQQKNQELQAVGNLTKQAYNSGRYKKDDGSFDNSKFADDVAQVAPTYGQGVANDATSRAGEIFKNQQTIQNLDQSKRSIIGDAFASDAGNNNITQADFHNHLEDVRQQFPDDKNMSRLLTSIGGSIDPNLSGPQLQSRLNQVAAMLKQQPSVAGQSNAAGQTINRGTFSGQLGPAGQQPGTQQNQDINPTNTTVAGRTAGATARGGGTGNADVDTSNNVVAAQRDAKTNIDLTKRIDQLADIVQPGALAAKVSAGLGSLGLSDINQARTELQKDLGRLQTSASSRAGSDERAKTILSGLPTDTTPTQTIHQAMDFTRGSARQDLALGKLREKSSSTTGGQMNGFQGDFAHATAAANPLMHEYLALSPQEQVGFFQRNFKTKEEAKAFRAQAESVKKLSPDVVGQ